MSRIFISYSHKDASELAEFLFVRLTGCGYEVWKDDHSLELGTSFPKEISDAVETQDCFIVLVSSSALASAWVQDEVDMAIVARRKIIPIFIGDVTPPLYLRKIQGLSLKTSVVDWKTLDKLVNGLENGKTIPRVYNMSGHKDIEIRGILVLGHQDFQNPDLADPKAISNIAQVIARDAVPYITSNAGIVPPGHPALACAVLAHLMGITTRLPNLYHTYKMENGKFGISSERFIPLQSIRELGFDYRRQL